MISTRDRDDATIDLYQFIINEGALKESLTKRKRLNGDRSSNLAAVKSNDKKNNTDHLWPLLALTEKEGEEEDKQKQEQQEDLYAPKDSIQIMRIMNIAPDKSMAKAKSKSKVDEQVSSSSSS